MVSVLVKESLDDGLHVPVLLNVVVELWDSLFVTVSENDVVVVVLIVEDMLLDMLPEMVVLVLAVNEDDTLRVFVLEMDADWVPLME